MAHNPAGLCDSSCSEVHFADHECSVENEDMLMSNYILSGRTQMQMLFNTYTCKDLKAICILTMKRRYVPLRFKYTF